MCKFSRRSGEKTARVQRPARSSNFKGRREGVLWVTVPRIAVCALHSAPDHPLIHPSRDTANPTVEWEIRLTLFGSTLIEAVFGSWNRRHRWTSRLRIDALRDATPDLPRKEISRAGRVALIRQIYLALIALENETVVYGGSTP
jgi:hypothetical protein